jgi:hypothetical protein
MLSGALRTSGFITLRRLKMKLKHIALIAFMLPTVAFAGAIATMPNEGGGKIVLTDEVCKHKDTTYSGLSRAYNYTTSGHSSEGCFYVEDETVVVIWDTTAGVRRMRYPAENFTLIKKKGARYGT